MYALFRLVAFFWIAVLCAGTLQYLSFKPDTDFLKLKQLAVASGYYLPAFYSHIFGSSIILIVGFFQFSKRIYTNPRLHRTLGHIYLWGIVFFAAPGAFVMTFFINRGTGVFISFILQNVLWLLFTVLAYRAIIKRNVSRHIGMMYRSYSLAFAAVTLRLYIWILSVAGIGVHFADNYLIIAFLSWIPNLLLVEILIHKRIGWPRLPSYNE
jgi:hypothetical protein